MEEIKKEILKNICYTDLVYERINKKLNQNYTRDYIEKFIYCSIVQTNCELIKKTGKNYYILNKNNNLKITINSNTFTVITVDKV